ncbi:MAG: V-type ATP synthase subunit B [Synergistaceae bacterium]|nr:V-type ATP synthase subunit B [Synergistaceae bacterium]
MANAEYIGVKDIEGPFVLVENVSGVGYGELVEIRDSKGRTRHGQVKSLSEKATLVQVFTGTEDLVPNTTKLRFLGKPLEIRLSKNMLGRTFNGLGEPRDGSGETYGGKKVNINGLPLNPMARQYPKDFINTGVSAIDTLTTLIRGQKLPIFSGNGLPHNQLAVQIATQAKIMGSDDFAVVFAGIGIKHDDAAYFTQELSARGHSNNIVTFLNLADDPVIERIATPRMALSTAEYLAYDLGLHVLVIITDMTSYCEALREIGVAAGEVPSRKGYPAYLYSDLASLYERAGVVRGLSGSVTQIPILTMPNDDITHPIPDLTGFITEGQIVLSRELDSRNIYPPIDILTSLSRLMKDGIGKGFTREDHPSVSSQLFASYSRVQEVRSLAGVVGEDELSKNDKMSLAFGRLFEENFLKQGKEEEREIGYSLDMAWEILSTLPRGELTRISLADIQEHIKKIQ